MNLLREIPVSIILPYLIRDYSQIVTNGNRVRNNASLYPIEWHHGNTLAVPITWNHARCLLPNASRSSTLKPDSWALLQCGLYPPLLEKSIIISISTEKT